MKSTILASFCLFLLLSVASITLSGAPFKVHAVNISCFFLAFVMGTFAAEKIWFKLPNYMVWLIFGTVGLFAWDLLSSLVIVKAELFLHWQFLYPFGLIGLVVLQFLSRGIANLPMFFKKSPTDNLE